MALIKHKDLWTAVTAPFAARFVNARPRDIEGFDIAKSNGFIERWRNAANTDDIDVMGVDAFNRPYFSDFHIRALRTPITFNLATNASLSTQRFFIADQNYEISAIIENHATADGVANTAFITKETSGQAPGAGTSVMTNTFNVNGTANTEQVATLTTRTPGIFGNQEGALSLAAGEMLSIKFAAGVTSLAGLSITLYARPHNSIAPARYVMNLNGDIATSAFFLTNRHLQITGVQAVWATRASGAPTITLDITKESSTTAPGSGTSILTAAINVANTSVVNVPVSPALTATAATLFLAPGDRLSVKTSGTLTALAGVVLVVSFANVLGSAGVVSPVAGMNMPIFNLAKAANLGVDQVFFIADRDYIVDDVSAVWSTAGGTSSRVTVTVETGTTAPGAGTSVLTDNSNAGIDITATANTVVVGTKAVSRRTLIVPAGARLSVHYAGTTSPVAGLVVAVSLLPF